MSAPTIATAASVSHTREALANSLDAVPNPDLLDTIKFCHPGYAASANVLFVLPRVDPVPSDPSSEAYLGVHHQTALIACQIVAGNAFNGYLSLDAGGEQKVIDSVGLDGVLSRPAYYFHIPGANRASSLLPAYWSMAG